MSLFRVFLDLFFYSLSSTKKFIKLFIDSNSQTHKIAIKHHCKFISHLNCLKLIFKMIFLLVAVAFAATSCLRTHSAELVTQYSDFLLASICCYHNRLMVCVELCDCVIVCWVGMSIASLSFHSNNTKTPPTLVYRKPL